ncbi:selenium metabolism protein YedF [Thermodesulfobium acidiphilum]|uniref:Selenium metabolism protein YedF n=1 Tax=Thermodesulfobium acidiphilum TaxID=1794699 RepID=A0A2R4W2G9_THEAF|nr:sulfurtransferase-like selenium metabolism protein YedF [Thermodesulfobium acidiphilum]AWB10920.1 selenium metabolism protein YedF [Thermodesulfobium acidiphilum]
MFELDCRGMVCPKPVVLTKQALKEHDEIIVIVDNKTSRDNLNNLAKDKNMHFEVEEKNNLYYCKIKKGKSEQPQERKLENFYGQAPWSVFIKSNTLGHGSDELGKNLINAFFDAILYFEDHPKVIAFMNSGVFLTLQDSECLKEIKMLEEKGSKILVCGTCLNFFNVKEKLAVGKVSNMFSILESLKGTYIIEP